MSCQPSLSSKELITVLLGAEQGLLLLAGLQMNLQSPLRTQLPPTPWIGTGVFLVMSVGLHMPLESFSCPEFPEAQLTRFFPLLWLGHSKGYFSFRLLRLRVRRGNLGSFSTNYLAQYLVDLLQCCYRHLNFGCLTSCRCRGILSSCRCWLRCWWGLSCVMVFPLYVRHLFHTICLLLTAETYVCRVITVLWVDVLVSGYPDTLHRKDHLFIVIIEWY